MFGDARKCRAPLAWCEGMRMALQGVPENFTGKGITVARGWVEGEERARFIGVVYHRKTQDEGVLLNFCPWCGADINASRTARGDGNEKAAPLAGADRAPLDSAPPTADGDEPSVPVTADAPRGLVAALVRHHDDTAPSIAGGDRGTVPQPAHPAQHATLEKALKKRSR